MAIYVVSIDQEKWEKFYPASLNKGKKWSWGRVDTGIFDDDELTELSANSICVLLYVVLRSAKHQRPTEISISEKKVCDRFNITSEQLISIFEWFENRGFLKVNKTSTPLVDGESLDSSPKVPDESLTSDFSVPNQSPDGDFRVSDTNESLTSDSCAPNQSLTSDFSVPNQAPYARTDDTIRNEEPPSPLPGGEGKSKVKIGRKHMDAWASRVLQIALWAIRENLSEEKALEKLTERGAKVLLFEYGKWANFEAAARREFAAGFGERFKASTLRAMKDILYLSIKADPPPSLTVINGGESLWPN